MLNTYILICYLELRVFCWIRFTLVIHIPFLRRLIQYISTSIANPLSLITMMQSSWVQYLRLA